MSRIGDGPPDLNVGLWIDRQGRVAPGRDDWWENQNARV
jgi:hypothetical protein